MVAEKDDDEDDDDDRDDERDDDEDGDVDIEDDASEESDADDEYGGRRSCCRSSSDLSIQVPSSSYSKTWLVQWGKPYFTDVFGYN